MSVLEKLGNIPSRKKKKGYKDIHGTTRVGDFLRSIGKSEVLSKVLGAAGEIATGDIMGAIKVIANSEELTPEQKDYALKMAEMDLVEMQEVTKRWTADMTSDSWLSKNIRPLTLGYLILATTIVAVLDSSIQGFTMDKAWIELLTTLDLAVIVSYFGSRGLEKFKGIIKR